jgi:NAD(P)-dependent dehydrogenase (short-subunit alcohol dehydrogenase family)
MKTALVTGAAQGVGFATAALLGRLGFRVVLLDVKPLDARFINGVALPVDGGWMADGGWESLRVRARS